MCSYFSLLWIFVIIWQPTYCFYNLCHTPQNTVLSDEECTDLYFDHSEKANILGHVKVELEGDSLKVTPLVSSWSKTFLRMSTPDNKTNQFCSKLTNKEHLKSFCVTLNPEMQNETFLLEYKIEDLPEINTRKFLFILPNPEKIPLFLYIDETDKSTLILHAQKLIHFRNNTYYRVEAYKEKNGNTNLEDFRRFSSNDDIYYELFTYNDVGNYYFVVSIINENCTDVSCPRVSTPKVFIGRKSTRVVIGIVGASFILPFVLFIFHILTRKYPDENQSIPDEKLVVAYKSSTKKHNEVVFALAALLAKMAKNDRIAVDVVDLSKSTRKFCSDPLILTNRVVYVAPPKNDVNPIAVDKSLSQKEIYAVIFDHCIDELPNFFEADKTFKLFEDFDKFIRALYISGSCNTILYQDLRRKTEEASGETDKMNADLPKIVISEIEPEERDSLISTKVVL